MNNKNTLSLTPFLTVNNGKKAVAFYTAAFGAVEEKRFELSGDKLSSKMIIANVPFYVADEEIENGNIAPDMSSAASVRLVLQTNEADVLFEKALQLGATAICPMTTEEDWRIGKLKDPFGHIWEIGYTL
jgi:PhnB protein